MKRNFIERSVIDTLAYHAFRDAVLYHIARELKSRWPHDESAEYRRKALLFFETQCTFDIEFLAGDDARECAEAEVDAAADSQ